MQILAQGPLTFILPGREKQWKLITLLRITGPFSTMTESEFTLESLQEELKYWKPLAEEYKQK